jgi:hypothetical protein
MARQTSRRLAAPAPSFSLILEAAVRAGLDVSKAGKTLTIHEARRTVELHWPPGPLVPKTAIPPLLGHRSLLRAAPSVAFSGQVVPPFLPGCAKPDIGTRGESFQVFRTTPEWTRTRALLTEKFILQPLLSGEELRVTICRSRVFAAAKLISRRGNRARWADVSDVLEPTLLAALHRIVKKLRMPGIGFDLMRTVERDVLLDVNLDPALAIHLATKPSHDLAPSFLEDWVRVVSEQSDTLIPPPQ